MFTEVDELALCPCGTDLAAYGPLCATCAAGQKRLLAWAEAKGWPRLELQPGVAIAEGEHYWQVFLGYPSNVTLWPLALRKAGLASGANV